MKTYVISDPHGCGLELRYLIEKIIKPSKNDKIKLGGDLFDRGLHADIIWQLIQEYNIECVLGNHERKMLKFLNGERDSIPPHYIYAIELLYKNGVSKQQLIAFLSSLPTLLYVPEHNTIIAHAGVNIDNPLEPNVSWNVYGHSNYHSAKDGFRIKQKLSDNEEITEEESKAIKEAEWWNLYNKKYRVVYGHTAQSDRTPRVIGNTIGIDTSVVHGFNITAYCLNDSSFYQYRSGVNWYAEFKEKHREKM